MTHQGAADGHSPLSLRRGRSQGLSLDRLAERAVTWTDVQLAALQVCTIHSALVAKAPAVKISLITNLDLSQFHLLLPKVEWRHMSPCFSCCDGSV